MILSNRFRLASMASCGAAALLASATAIAQVPASGRNLEPSSQHSAIYRRETPIVDSGDYRQELQACLSGASPQPHQACLEEARSARAADRRGQLRDVGEDYRANALARCEPLEGEYQAACEARVMGFGNASGSVAGGGLLRWVETVVVPADAGAVSIAPRTQEPVVLVPMAGNRSDKGGAK